jgi:hypothetical protein
MTLFVLYAILSAVMAYGGVDGMRRGKISARGVTITRRKRPKMFLANILFMFGSSLCLLVLALRALLH